MNWKALVAGTVAKTLGWVVATVVVTILGLHLWTDHVSFHQMVAFINEYATEIQKLKPRVPQSSPAPSTPTP